MSANLTASKCSLPVADNVCFNIDGVYYVTAQPIYILPSTNPYQVLAKAGIQTVLSVRDPQEVILPFIPVDLSEVSQLVTNGVAFTNVPLPHIDMTQAQFNQQAYKAATVISAWPKPLLVHCSTGDRASAAYAAFLISYVRLSNDAAIAYATQQLALQNTQFIAWLKAYQTP